MLSTVYKLLPLLIVAFLAVIATNVESQIAFPGQCPNYQTQVRFNPGAFVTGTWYEILRYPSAFEELSRCSSLDIKTLNSFMGFTFRGINSSDQSLISVKGKAYFGQGELSKLVVNLPVQSKNQTSSNVLFWVLDTDYQNYAVVWGCYSLCEGYHVEQAWVLGRKRTLDQSILDNIDGKFVKNGPFKKESLIAVDQERCEQPVLVKAALDDFATNNLEK